MLINPSWYFFRKNYFWSSKKHEWFLSKFQVIQILATKCENTQNMLKNDILKNSNLLQTTARTRFFPNIQFCKVVDNVALTTYDWMQSYGQETSKTPLKWGFSPISESQDFFKNQALSLLYPYGAMTSCTKLEKN